MGDWCFLGNHFAGLCRKEDKDQYLPLWHHWINKSHTSVWGQTSSEKAWHPQDKDLLAIHLQSTVNKYPSVFTTPSIWAKQNRTRGQKEAMKKEISFPFLISFWQCKIFIRASQGKDYYPAAFVLFLEQSPETQWDLEQRYIQMHQQVVVPTKTIETCGKSQHPQVNQEPTSPQGLPSKLRPGVKLWPLRKLPPG